MASQDRQRSLPPPVGVPEFLSARSRGYRLTVLTAYDFAMARIFDAAGVDAILVGDSLGMVIQGNDTPLPVTLEEMIYHTRLVSRAAKRSLVIADMPFMTYQISPEQALENAGRLVQSGGAHAVKLEGGVRSAKAIEAIVAAEIPVMGHVGLTPQSVRKVGGFKVQRDAAKLIDEAKAVQAAGAFAVVVECVPAETAAEIRSAVSIPTIGIGAGPECDGQVLVAHDMLGMFADFRPRFVKVYADVGTQMTQAAEAFRADVQNGTFPGKEHSFR